MCFLSKHEKKNKQLEAPSEGPGEQTEGGHLSPGNKQGALKIGGDFQNQVRKIKYRTQADRSIFVVLVVFAGEYLFSILIFKISFEGSEMSLIKMIVFDTWNEI